MSRVLSTPKMLSGENTTAFSLLVFKTVVPISCASCSTSRETRADTRASNLGWCTPSLWFACDEASETRMQNITSDECILRWMLPLETKRDKFVIEMTWRFQFQLRRSQYRWLTTNFVGFSRWFLFEQIGMRNSLLWELSSFCVFGSNVSIFGAITKTKCVSLRWLSIVTLRNDIAKFTWLWLWLRRHGQC